MEIIIGTLLVAGFMAYKAVQLANRNRMYAFQPTLGQSMRADVCKDPKTIMPGGPRPEGDPFNIEDFLAEAKCLEVVTFIVRFVCRDEAMPYVLKRPRFSIFRAELANIVEPVFCIMGITDPTTATQRQITQACCIIMHSSTVLPRLFKFCCEYMPEFTDMYVECINPQWTDRRKIPAHRAEIPSNAAMLWLRDVSIHSSS